MNRSGSSSHQYLFSLWSLSALVLVLAVVITWFAPKDDNSDAWAYHYYSGAMLLEDRLDLDYFGASSQSYFNPLVHAPFAAMVKANWPDRWVATVMALYSAMSLVLAAVFYRYCLGLKNWELVAALAMSLSCLLVWTCTGSSASDLFLQIPVMLSLLYLFSARVAQPMQRLAFSGFFFGVALGLKLSAIVYIPGFGVLLLLWLLRHEIRWLWLIGYCLGAVAGFLLVYSWWGVALYKHFGNPFFPFFNQWFQSPHFSTEALVNKRFISESLLEQAMLPFRMSLSDVFTYIELRLPDIRPAAFVLSIVALLFRRIWKEDASKLHETNNDFLIFLVVSLYTWVFISGNGRYGVGILVLLGAGIVISLRALFPLKWYRSILLLVLLLQLIVIAQSIFLGPAAFRFRNTPWGGQWFNVDVSEVLGKGNQLILTGTRSSYSVLVKDIGPNSSLINVYGLFALENNPTIESKIEQYKGNILGMFMTGPNVTMDHSWIDGIYFEQFGRFGLRVPADATCKVVPKVELDGRVGANFIFCPLVSDAGYARKYEEMTSVAGNYFRKIETICPDLFSPTKYAVTLSGTVRAKFYANYELDVYVGADQHVMGKKQWSMMMFDLGSVPDAFSMPAAEWKEKYCEPLRRSRAMSRE